MNDIECESLAVAKDAAEWAYWSMIGTWFAGLATFLAVVVALYLGLKPYIIRVKSELCIRSLEGTNETKVQLIVRNLSFSAIYINNTSIVTGGIFLRNSFLYKCILGGRGNTLYKSKIRRRHELKVAYRYVELKEKVSSLVPYKVEPFGVSIFTLSNKPDEWIEKQINDAKLYGFDYKKIAVRITLVGGKVTYSDNRIDMCSKEKDNYC